MFTGIVQGVGDVEALEPRGGDLRLRVTCPRLDLSRTAAGDSICVQGCCLTITDLAGRGFSVDVSRESLALTTLGELRVGSRVNLEPALRAGDPLGGHLVSGHVDGVAEVRESRPDGRSTRVLVAAPAALRRFIAPKGSVTLDGVSLTVNEVHADTFGINLIPHTQSVTTLGSLNPGARLNLEVDLLARYLARLLELPIEGRAPFPAE
ncbi:MAG: riboflavin synthase [Gammaproteobacteria bacterium]|nr:riboflavin synthase [Gammaproteobacteria bacterium]MBV9621993.1 riboflavin synthase [Gammaproteobacteria bacterium]